jgi:hypothetical protein
VVYERRKGVAREPLIRTSNWERLKEAGLTFEQAKVVHSILDSASAFGYQWLADSAYRQLEEVYGEVKVG